METTSNFSFSGTGLSADHKTRSSPGYYTALHDVSLFYEIRTICVLHRWSAKKTVRLLLLQKSLQSLTILLYVSHSNTAYENATTHTGVHFSFCKIPYRVEELENHILQ